MELVVGHDGIYEVTVGEVLVYTNQSRCGAAFPSAEEVIPAVTNALGVDVEGLAQATAGELDDAPACPIPGAEDES